MRKKPRRPQCGSDDLVGPKYQFNRALAQELLSASVREGCRCLACGQVRDRMLQLARYLSPQECCQYQLSRDHGVVVVIACEDCLRENSVVDILNQKIYAALDRREVSYFDLGALDLPEAFQ